nr:MAG TPA: hypothetical protein [Caudoviricetes sp.]
MLIFFIHDYISLRLDYNTKSEIIQLKVEIKL